MGFCFCVCVRNQSETIRSKLFPRVSFSTLCERCCNNWLFYTGTKTRSVELKLALPRKLGNVFYTVARVLAISPY